MEKANIMLFTLTSVQIYQLLSIWLKLSKAHLELLYRTKTSFLDAHVAWRQPQWSVDSLSIYWWSKNSAITLVGGIQQML